MDNPLENFWSHKAEEILGTLQTQPSGLSNEEVLKRHAAMHSGLREHSRPVKDVLLFLSQFKSPLVLLLVAAVILSAVLGENTDVAIILSILLFTGSLGFWQERKAGKAVEALRAIIRVNAKVLRDHVAKDVPTGEIVPGDIILFAAGNIIPADCFLIESKDLHTNEASLTGETYPAEKEAGIVEASTSLSKRSNVLYEGTSVVSGTAKAVAVFTGNDTVFGKLSKGLQEPAAETAFEKGIRSFGYLLMRITLVLSIVILGINLYFGRPLLDSLLFALALTVGMAPELLPAIMTIAMASGARRMADEKVIVKKLSAIQNLGEVNILCSDKTGTLTEGTIQVARAADVNGKDSDRIMQLAFLNAKFESGFSNPIDDALRSLKNVPSDGFSKSDEVPYDFIRKRLTVVVSKGEKRLMITKGALQNILQVCDRVEASEQNIVPVESLREQIEKLYLDFSSEGFRTIGICYKELADTNPVRKEQEIQMIFAGFILLNDPPKAGIADVIKQLAKRGVSLKMITGDNKLVAAYIGKQIGFENTKVITGGDLIKMSPEALIAQVAGTDVFAEIEPNQKEQIIHAFQKAGNAVAYIGDGVNDVAALHAADAGISVNNAVDVAKEAADIVLLEKDLSVLEKGIVEGRKTFVNTLKYIYINTSATFGNMFSMAGASLILPFLPLLPKQILLTNFITDFPYMFVASDRVDEERLQRPQKWNNKRIRNFMLLFGLQSSVFDYLTFYVLYMVFHLNAEHFRTGWFLESITTELLILFIVRTRHSFIKSKPGKMLFVSSISAIIVTLLLLYTPLASPLGFQPLPPLLLLSITFITIAYALTAEWLKIYFFKKVQD